MSLYNEFPFKYIEGNGYHKDQNGNFQDLHLEDFVCTRSAICTDKLYKTIIKPRVTHVCVTSPDYNIGIRPLKDRPFFLSGCVTICVNIFVSIVYILQLHFFISWKSEIYPYLIMFQYIIISIIGYLFYYFESNDIAIIANIKRTILMSVGFLTILAFCYLVRKIQKLKNEYTNDTKSEEL
jgi:hypothetical protein